MMLSAMTRQLEAMDMRDAGITTPTITSEEAEKWGMQNSDHFKWSCLVREVAKMPLANRRKWIDKVASEFGEEECERFKSALKFEWEKSKKRKS